MSINMIKRLWLPLFLSFMMNNDATVLQFSSLVSQAGNPTAAFNNFVLQATKPVVVKFYMPNCGPCAKMSPIFASASAALEDQVIFIELNAKTYSSIANTYSIRSVPTFIFFQNGQQKVRQIGTKDTSTGQPWTTQAFISKIKQYFSIQ